MASASAGKSRENIGPPRSYPAAAGVIKKGSRTGARHPWIIARRRNGRSAHLQDHFFLDTTGSPVRMDWEECVTTTVEVSS